MSGAAQRCRPWHLMMILHDDGSQKESVGNTKEQEERNAMMIKAISFFGRTNTDFNRCSRARLQELGCSTTRPAVDIDGCSTWRLS